MARDESRRNDAIELAGIGCVFASAAVVVYGLAQGYATYSEPCHVLEGLLASGMLRHGGHPVLRWMASQMVVKFGPNDAIRPWKPHGSGLRNDGIVALLMALNRALLYQDQPIIASPTLFLPGVNL